jgi:uncharacterized membrane protein YqiK
MAQSQRGRATMSEIVVILLIVTVMVVIQVAAMALVLGRFYRKAPPGKILVRAGHGGMRVVSGGGVFVIPAIHRFVLMDAEVESLNYDGKEILVQIGEQPEEVIRACKAFGQKPIEEIKRLLQTMVDSADGSESALKEKLAEVGYRII